MNRLHGGTYTEKWVAADDLAGNETEDYDAESLKDTSSDSIQGDTGVIMTVTSTAIGIFFFVVRCNSTRSWTPDPAQLPSCANA